MMTFIAKILKATFQKENGVPGKSIDVDLETVGSNGDDAEQSYPAGIMGLPHKDIQGVGIKVDGQNIIVSNFNYGFDKDIDNGSTMLYGYDESGKVKAYVLADADGLLTLKTELDSLKAWNTRVLRAFIDHFDSQGAPTYHNRIGPVLTALLEEEVLNLDKIFKE